MESVPDPHSVENILKKEIRKKTANMYMMRSLFTSISSWLHHYTLLGSTGPKISWWGLTLRADAWLTSLIPSRQALCNADHIIMSILFSFGLLDSLISSPQMYYGYDVMQTNCWTAQPPEQLFTAGSCDQLCTEGSSCCSCRVLYWDRIYPWLSTCILLEYQQWLYSFCTASSYICAFNVTLFLWGDLTNRYNNNDAVQKPAYKLREGLLLL